VSCMSGRGAGQVGEVREEAKLPSKLISGCRRRPRPVRVIAQGWSTYVGEIAAAVMRYPCVARDMGRIRTFR
jgi:hypothetical protein